MKLSGFISFNLLCLISLIKSDADYSYCDHRWESSTFFASSDATLLGTSYRGSKGHKDHHVDIIAKSSSDIEIVNAEPEGTFREGHEKLLKNSGGFCQKPGDVLHSADADGDKKHDLICHRSDGIITAMTYHRSHYQPKATIAKGFHCDQTTSTLLIGDFDGNHAVDFLCLSKNKPIAEGSLLYFNGVCSLHRRYKRSYYHGERYPHSQYLCTKNHQKKKALQEDSFEKCDISVDRLFTADFNGDSKDDVICHKSSNNEVHAYLSHGAEALALFSTLPNSIVSEPLCDAATNTIIPADIDGDGDNDFICASKDAKPSLNSQMSIAYFVNGRFQDPFTPMTCSNTKFCYDDGLVTVDANPINYIVGDFNGNGRDDLMCRYGDRDHFKTKIVFSEHSP